MHAVGLDVSDGNQYFLFSKYTMVHFGWNFSYDLFLVTLLSDV
jgi:hypothetical protein